MFMRKSKWKGYRKKEGKRSRAARKSTQNALIYLMVLLIVIVVVYLSYTVILPQLASFIDGMNPGPADTAGTVVKFVYVKS
jgi:type II secretory pathway component PulF